MRKTTEEKDSIEEIPWQLSPSDLDREHFQPRSTTRGVKKKPLREQVSQPPRNAVKIKNEPADPHFCAALWLTITCFFLIGPCWALWKSFRVRRLVREGEHEAAEKLSHRISTVLMISLILGIFAWVGILFCSLGLIISGAMLRARLV